MTILQSIILGIVEGFTEFLPISSTAHLSLASEILNIAQSDFVKTFEIAIQSGAILAVIVIYWRKFSDKELLKKILVAFIPTAIIGFILYKLIKSYLIGNIGITLTALFLGGIVLIIFEKFTNKSIGISDADIKSLSYRKTAFIGIFQALAVIPGISRSAATIVSGRLLGLSRVAVVEFSFLLAVPTILAATGYDLMKNYSLFSNANITILAFGFVFSFITAILGIKFFLKYISSKSLSYFGIYRIAIAIIFFVYFLLK